MVSRAFTRINKYIPSSINQPTKVRLSFAFIREIRIFRKKMARTVRFVDNLVRRLNGSGIYEPSLDVAGESVHLEYEFWRDTHSVPIYRLVVMSWRLEAPATDSIRKSARGREGSEFNNWTRWIFKTDRKAEGLIGSFDGQIIHSKDSTLSDAARELRGHYFSPAFSTGEGWTFFIVLSYS